MDTSRLVTTSSDYGHGGTQKDVYSRDDVIEVPCPYCGGARRELLMTEFESVGVVRCGDCELMYTSPRTKEPEKVYWGDAAKYAEEARLIVKGQAPHHRDRNYEEELAQIRQYKAGGRFLDVGCNMGFLLRKAKSAGWDAVGVDPSPSLSKMARETWGVPVHNCFLDALPEHEHHAFDVVALSDVFEHITTPLPFLEDVKRAMKPDAILYVKVPNARFSLLKQRVIETVAQRPSSGIWDSCEHVVHYTEETIRKMLEKAGLSVVEVSFGRPVQLPVWHELVGHYYLHPSPWYLDWRRHIGRAAFYLAAFPERTLLGRVGSFAPNLVVVARLAKPS